VIWDVGDTAVLDEFRVTNPSGVLTDATVTVTVTKPDATTTTPTPTHPGTGLYDATVTVDQAGLWTWLWTASGTVVAKQPGQFTAVAPRVLVADFDELRAFLNRTDHVDDDELRTFLHSATDVVEYFLGGPVTVQSFTEQQPAPWDSVIRPRKKPLVSVTSITPYQGSAVASSAYWADTALNAVRFRTGWAYGFFGEITIVYTAGQARLSESAKLAGLITAQHLWQTQNGAAGLPLATDTTFVPGLGFAIPNRAKELLTIQPVAAGIA
jgi:hypothetical protein